MRLQIFGFMLMGLSLPLLCAGQEHNRIQNGVAPGEMIIRIAEIEIEPAFLDEYLTILKEESETSVRLEPGVICIYPMYQKAHPTEIHILEVYAGEDAYEAHLQTPHFKHYKMATQKMVRSLKLVEMETIDKKTMFQIFRKLNNQEFKN